jgi:hypothetical protein
MTESAVLVPAAGGGPLPAPIPAPEESGGRELFRRAVCLHDEAAWAALLATYGGLVAHWARQLEGAADPDEDGPFWATRAFERFWAAVGPERFDAFPDLRALLRYLKLCAHSAVLTERRRRVAAGPGAGAGAAAGAVPAGAGPGWPPRAGSRAAGLEGDPAIALEARLGAREVWAAVARALSDDPAARRVVYLSFARDLSPREIQARDPDRYPTVAEVYRIKRNAMDRLRRAPALRALAGGGRAAGER